MTTYKYILLTIIALACSTIANAQELKVVSFEKLLTDVTARSNAVKDGNGDVCALIKVSLPVTGCEFAGNIVGKPEFHISEYWVYMTQGTKSLEIRCPGCKTFLVDLKTSDGKVGVESAVTYRLELSGYPNVAGGSTADPGANFLILDIEPKTASGIFVKIDGQTQPVENGQVTAYLEYGNYHYTIEAEGYAPQEGTATIRRGDNTTVNIRLESVMANLAVHSETSGATIKINGQEKGTGNWQGAIVPGMYRIEVSKAGYRNYVENIRLSQHDNRTINIPSLTPILGFLKVAYQPTGSDIAIDGKNVGKTPKVLSDVIVGRHDVSITKEGYAPFNTSVNIIEGQTAQLDGSLQLSNGYADANTKYGFVGEYDDNGLAIVIQKGKWGVIDKTGQIVIPLVYDYIYIGKFSEGLASVEQNGKRGLIDKTGKVVMPLVYDDLYVSPEGLVMVQQNGKYGCADKKGKIVIPLIYENSLSFSEGLAIVEKDGKKGFIDKTGKVVIPLIYESALYFTEGLAMVAQNGKYGFIDKTGKIAIPLVYDSAWLFSEGLAMVTQNYKWGFIDKTGKVVIPLNYDWTGRFSDGLAAVKQNEKWGFIDKTGKVVIPYTYYDYVGDFSEGLAVVKQHEKWGIIDKTGKIVIPLVYDDPFYYYEGLACVKQNEKYGYIDKTGKVVIPLIYDSPSSFSRGLAKVKLNGEEFYINKQGVRIE